jgi:putative methanogenesis marker protein 3
MKVKVNGEKIELSSGSTIRDAIRLAEAPYLPGCVISLVKGKEEVERYVNKYRFKTTSGSIIIELLKNSPPELVKTWKKHYKDFKGLRIRWTTSQEVAVGPLTTDLIPSREEYSYDRWDVIFSLSGFTADATHIIFNKDKHEAVYGVPEGTDGVFAKIVGGKRTIMNLTDEDHILDVKPVVERKSIVNSAAITDLDTTLEDGNQIFTYIQIQSDARSPQSVEQLFALGKNDKIRVDYDSNSFLGFYGLQKLKRDVEYIGQRKRGAVTLRNNGKGIGRIYIYREDRVSTPSHNLLGTVEHGIQLIDMAREGDEITLKTSPNRIMALSMTQIEAEELLKTLGIKHIRDGVTDDDAMIVIQEPKLTMDIVSKGELKTTGINADELVYLELNDLAPRSNWYFRKITGLLDSPVGSLKVQFAYPGMNLVMFYGDSREAIGLVPENTPQNKVEMGSIGITNMSRRHIGMVGMRFEENEEFGPTAEPFEGTNIIGKVVKGMENLDKYKQGEIVYVTTKI